MRRFHRKTMAWSRLSISLLLLLVLTACTPSQGRYTAMRTALDSINMLNRTDQPFTVADVQPYVDYFDRYGNSTFTEEEMQKLREWHEKRKK